MCLIKLKNKTMQTLLFNTTEKTVRLYEGLKPEGTLICKFNSVPTVKIYDGYYEVKQKDEDEKTYPVARFPVNITNMFIDK
jgi:predicted SAM-dependent methyltransferase